jgi:ubiquinone/menaquinone biosynthesis C-methylase UbiE
VSHWFERIADHAGSAYLRYSFTKGTAQEVEFLTDRLRLRPGMRLLDVGCGPGRHAHAFAAAEIEVVGVDISQRFVELAADRGGGSFVRADARQLPIADGAFDVAVSLCQGGFGLVGERDADVIREMARVVRPGGVLAVSAFSSYFAVRFLEETDTFDAATGVNHERTTVRDESGAEAEFDLWTSCFTPRELGLLAERAGLVVEAIWSVTPGDYGERAPDLDHPEFLLVARSQENGAVEAKH